LDLHPALGGPQVEEPGVVLRSILILKKIGRLQILFKPILTGGMGEEAMKLTLPLGA
jgi:hypothetical protein